MAEDSIKVRYKGDNEFEILVNPEEAFKFKNGEIEDFGKVLFVREIFKDAGAAERASASDIKDEFGTENILEAAEKLFEKGSMQLTTDQKNKKREEKKKRVISMIARRAMNPKTNSPHPPQRIKNALKEAGVHFDALKSAEEQFEDAVKAIRPIIPISLEEKEFAVKIPNNYAGKCYGKIKTQANIMNEEWGDEGFMAKCKMPAGAKSQLESEIQKICHGEAVFKDI